MDFKNVPLFFLPSLACLFFKTMCLDGRYSTDCDYLISKTYFDLISSFTFFPQLKSKLAIFPFGQESFS